MNVIEASSSIEECASTSYAQRAGRVGAAEVRPGPCRRREDVPSSAAPGTTSRTGTAYSDSEAGVSYGSEPAAGTDPFPLHSGLAVIRRRPRLGFVLRVEPGLFLMPLVRQALTARFFTFVVR